MGVRTWKKGAAHYMQCKNRKILVVIAQLKLQYHWRDKEINRTADFVAIQKTQKIKHKMPFLSPKATDYERCIGNSKTSSFSVTVNTAKICYVVAATPWLQFENLQVTGCRGGISWSVRSPDVTIFWKATLLSRFDPDIRTNAHFLSKEISRFLSSFSKSL